MWSIVIRIVIGIRLIVLGFAYWQITTDRRRIVGAGSRTWLRTNVGSPASEGCACNRGDKPWA